MGSAESKANRDSYRCVLNSEPEDLIAKDSTLSSSGVRLHQVDANNFLGRLQDAERFSQLSVWNRLLMLLGQRNSQLPAKESHQATLDQLVEQQEKQAQACQQDCCSACSTAAHSITGGSQQNQRCHNPRCSSDGSASDNGLSARTAVEDSSTEAHRQDLTTLLRQGFDPAAYEKRQLMARFAQPEKFGFDPRAV